MRALTLKQPWLYAIEHLGKRVENRSWVIPTNLRDQWIALHAGKARDEVEWLAVEKIHGKSIYRGKAMYGTITSVAKFGPSILIDAQRYKPSVKQWYFGPYGWLITDLIILEEPLPCRGMLGLWTVPAEIEEKIKEQLPSLDFENSPMELQL